MLYFESDYLTVAWNEREQWIETVWRGYTGGGSGKARSGSNKVLELIVQKHASKILNDLRQLHITDISDQEWFGQIWLPQAVEAGLRYSANVLPERALVQVALRTILSPIGNYVLERSNFDDLPSAIKWLQSK